MVKRVQGHKAHHSALQFFIIQTQLYNYNLYRIQTRQVCQITIVCINGNHFSGYKRMNNFFESNSRSPCSYISDTNLPHQIIHFSPSLPILFLFASFGARKHLGVTVNQPRSRKHPLKKLV